MINHVQTEAHIFSKHKLHQTWNRARFKKKMLAADWDQAQKYIKLQLFNMAESKEHVAGWISDGQMIGECRH